MSENNNTKSNAGGALAGALCALGVSCDCVDFDSTPNTIIYHFNLHNIKDLPKVKKATALLSAVLHEQVTFSESDKAHFALIFARQDREIIPFTNAYYTADLKPLDALIGIDSTGRAVKISVDDMVSALCVGTSGSGKSTFLHSFICSLCCSTRAEKLGFVLIDCKRSELMRYNEKCAHLMCNVVTEPQDALTRLNQVIDIMKNRYATMEARKINTCPADFSRIVIIVDELAELMLSTNKRIAQGTKTALIRLCQLGRACGIHCVLCTQSPRVAVIDGLIQTNTPTKFALRTSSSRESVIAIGHGGCESLFGRGDMIYKPADDIKERRLQVPYISASDIEKIFANLPTRERQAQPTKTEKPKKSYKERLFEVYKRIQARQAREHERSAGITLQDCIDFDTMDDDE